MDRLVRNHRESETKPPPSHPLASPLLVTVHENSWVAGVDVGEFRLLVWLRRRAARTRTLDARETCLHASLSRELSRVMQTVALFS